MKIKPHGAKRVIRVGVFGARRGVTFAKNAGIAGMKLTAICDCNNARISAFKKQMPGVKVYRDFDKMLGSGIDAVVLANYFNEHVPFALKALKAGVHVMSETSACRTLSEGVQLARAVEESGKIYLFAENYCYFNYIQEMRNLYQQGEIGTALFSQCEYVHPVSLDQRLSLSPGHNHWRNWIPSTYYCTHSLGPIIYITGERPISVNARSVPYSKDISDSGGVKRGDCVALMTCTMSNQSVCVATGWAGISGHGNWYRVHGSRGLMENLRDSGRGGYLRIVHEPWEIKDNNQHETIYDPKFPIADKRIALSGHGGGDFFTSYHFAEAIRKGKQPFLDVYRGIDMTITGIQAWKSCLDEGNNYEVPDFRKESVRKKYEDDHFSPYPEDRDKAPNQPPPSINGYNEPSAKMKKMAEKSWRSAPAGK